MKSIIYLLSLSLLFLSCVTHERTHPLGVGETVRYKLCESDSIWSMRVAYSGGSMVHTYVKGNLFFVQVNNTVYGGYRQPPNVHINDDGNLWWIVYQKANKEYVIVNGRTYGGYDHIYGLNNSLMGPSMLGLNGYYFAGSSGKSIVMNINGKTWGPFDMDCVSTPNFFGTDNSKYSFSFRSHGQTYLCLNGSMIPVDGSMGASSNKSGDMYGYTMKKGKEWFVNVNGKEYGPYDYVKSNVYYSAEGSSFGFEYQKNDKWHLNINGRSYGDYDVVWWPVFNKDGSNYGFLAHNGKKYTTNGNITDGQWYVHVNDSRFGPYDQMTYSGGPYFSPSGKHFYFIYNMQGQKDAYGDIVGGTNTLCIDGDKYYNVHEQYYYSVNIIVDRYAFSWYTLPKGGVHEPKTISGPTERTGTSPIAKGRAVWQRQGAQNHAMPNLAAGR